MKKLLAVFLLASAGCASLGQGAAETLAIQYATLKVASNPEKAARVVDIATEAKSLLAIAETSTVAAVKVAVQERLAKLNLDPADQLLASALVEAVAAELQARVGEGLIDPEKLVRVNAVLDAVIEAAKIAAG